MGELRLTASVGGPCVLPAVVLGLSVDCRTRRDITWPMLEDAQGELPVDGVCVQPVFFSCGGVGDYPLIDRTQRDRVRGAC